MPHHVLPTFVPLGNRCHLLYSEPTQIDIESYSILVLKGSYQYQILSIESYLCSYYDVGHKGNTQLVKMA